MIILLGALLSVPFLLIYGTWAWAVVIQKTWAWFTVPAFAVSPLTFTQAIAVSIFVSVFFIKSTPVKTELTPDGEVDWGKVIAQLVAALVLPWFVLIINLILSWVFI